MSNLVSVTETSVEGRQSWNARFGLTNYSVRICPSLGVCVTTNVAPDGSFTVTSNYLGRTISVTRKDSSGNHLGQTIIGYDSHGRQNTMTDARNGTTTFAFNAADQVVTHTTPSPDGVQSGLVTINFYNNVGRVWKTIQPDGGIVTNDFNPNAEVEG